MEANGQNMGLHYEGVLEKAGKRFFEGFRKRWFILEGKDLSYYKAQERTEQNLLGIIDMTKVRSVVPFKMINNSFQIMTSTRTYTFTAPSMQLMTEWISVLRQAMQLESFSNKRARSSIRESPTDEGYEVVPSISSRSNSKISQASHQSFDDDDACDDGNLYDTVSSNTQGKTERTPAHESQGFYAPVGSFKRKNSKNKSQAHEDQGYEVVGRNGSLPRDANESDFGAYDAVLPIKRMNSKGSNASDLGSYGVVGEQDNKEPGNKPQDQGYIYAQVEKPLSPESPPVESSDSFYAEVGSVEGLPNTRNSKASKETVVNSMPVLVESDVDDEDEDANEQDSLVDENIEPLKDPLPSPIGDIYAADKIKNLLIENDGDLNGEKHKSNEINDKDCSPISESCEKAFNELKSFLVYLEKADN